MSYIVTLENLPNVLADITYSVLQNQQTITVDFWNIVKNDNMYINSQKYKENNTIFSSQNDTEILSFLNSIK